MLKKQKIHKKWQTLKSKIVFKNPWWHVRKDDFVRPDGGRGVYYVIDGLHAVKIIAQDLDGGIYLVGQTRYAIGKKYSWELIGGGIKDGQTPLQAAKEELEEEAGLRAKKWKRLGYFHTNQSIAAEKVTIFLAQDLEHVGAKNDVTEEIRVSKRSLDEIIKMIEDNKIFACPTIAAIFKFRRYLMNGGK